MGIKKTLKKVASKAKARDRLVGRAARIVLASMVNSSRLALLALLYQNTAWPNVGDVGGLQPSATAGSFFISLHTAPPGAGGNQQTNEATYTGYARIPVARSNVGWTLTGPTPTQVANAIQILFGLCTAGSETITDFAVGTKLTGTGEIIDTGAVNTPLAVAAGVQPQFAIGDLTVNVT